MDTKKTYRTAYKCRNCQWMGYIDIPFGTIAPEHTDTPCPTCGCKTLARDRNSYTWLRTRPTETPKRLSASPGDRSG